VAVGPGSCRPSCARYASRPDAGPRLVPAPGRGTPALEVIVTSAAAAARRMQAVPSGSQPICSTGTRRRQAFRSGACRRARRPRLPPRHPHSGTGRAGAAPSGRRRIPHTRPRRPARARGPAQPRAPARHRAGSGPSRNPRAPRRQGRSPRRHPGRQRQQSGRGHPFPAATALRPDGTPGSPSAPGAASRSARVSSPRGGWISPRWSAKSPPRPGPRPRASPRPAREAGPGERRRARLPARGAAPAGLPAHLTSWPAGSRTRRAAGFRPPAGAAG
jgi:hypothetical protein